MTTSFGRTSGGFGFSIPTNIVDFNGKKEREKHSIHQDGWILQKLNILQDCHELSDVQFCVGQGNCKKVFKAHRLILAMSSDVFKAMFFGQLKEKDSVEIVDVSPDVFEYLLMYMYGRNLPKVTIHFAREIYYAADKYLIDGLKASCLKLISERFSIASASVVCEFAEDIKDENLFNKAFETILYNIHEYIRSISFRTASTNVIKKLLGTKLYLRQGERRDRRAGSFHNMSYRDIYSNIKDIDIWKALCEWSKERCKTDGKEPTPANQREALLPILPYVQFLTMSSQDFTCGPAKSGILSDEESLAILMNIVVYQSQPLPDWMLKTKTNSDV
ncbi:BTB/POZ domain-containing protein 6-like [Limulus polyphemus]|uniref:BTB/POZ domain-containing protein 6-like n=1 Tax=Limulus polyphemus TaxID=6850 RepID=A0ABM1BHI8_LIMPO|nr:BTB/POZ domain-containing protein 6-like [Limulus polyphemus]XP_013782112.1 BTB/POZ domain-containing protein 6-like [Limulus polyphemus]XP_022250077.1 BTB/POZ domain-containing protein 6-like [Limulus polyphemus]